MTSGSEHLFKFRPRSRKTLVPHLLDCEESQSLFLIDPSSSVLRLESYTIELEISHSEKTASMRFLLVL